MKIGLNTLFMVPGGVGGTEIYARNLIRALVQTDRRNDYVIFANRENAAIWKEYKGEGRASVFVCPVRGAAKIQRTLYEQFRLNADARRAGVDLLHSLGYVMPPPSPGLKSVVTIGDVIFRRFPKEFSLLQRVAAGVLTGRAARQADRVLTFSEHSRRDVAAEFDAPMEKIDVAYLAFNEFPDRPDEADAFFKSRSINAPYIYTACSTYYHKNLETLLAALQILHEKHRAPHTLVVSGLAMAAHGRLTEQIRQMGLESSIVMAGWVPEPVMRGLYSRAACFIFPSLYEGFGLPVLEAMALGTPVVCSNATSLPEVAGGAALMCDPLNAGEMADALWRCVSDEGLRKDLAERGRRQAERFSWERCARQTLECYQRLGAA